MSFKTVNEYWIEEINGMVIYRFQLNLEVGELPKVNFSIFMRAFVEKLSKEKLKKLIEYCEMRLECLT